MNTDPLKADTLSSSRQPPAESSSGPPNIEEKGYFTRCQAFPATRWSLVATAGADGERSAEALGELCRTYWIPIYCFIRRSGRSREDAEDLTQGFFARVLDADILAKARQDRGKLRTFLLGILKRFLCDEYDKERAQKRGGKFAFVSLDYQEGERSFERACSKAADPSTQYDRQWALSLLTETLESLRSEYEANGRAGLFATLSPVLTQQSLDQPYQEIGEELELSANAVTIAIYRLRQRYREMLCARIADTVDSAEEMSQEISYLCELFAQHETTVTYSSSKTTDL